MMTVWGLRILPLCMPLSIICMHFTCYGQASDKQGLVHVLGLLDGVICVAGFTALLIRSVGVNSVYIANILNGTVTTLVVIGYAWLKKKRFPRNMDELMVVPDDIGAPENARMDLSVGSMEGVRQASFTADGYSESYGSAESRTAAIEKQLTGSIEALLGGVTDDEGTPLLFAGVPTLGEPWIGGMIP